MGMIKINLFITSIYITTRNNNSLFAKLSYIGLVIFAILIIINT